jgi:hypothetical protein
MNVACPPDEPVARHPHNAAHGGRHSAQPTEAAGERHADYLLRLLTQIRQRIDNRIERYRRVATIFEASGNVEYAQTFRHLRFLEEQDGQILDELIDNVHRRFPPRAPG